MLFIYLIIYLYVEFYLRVPPGCLPSVGIWPPRTIWDPLGFARIWPGLLFRRKVVCFVLFCSYEIHRTGMLQIVFLVSLESSQRGESHGLGSMTIGLDWTCGAKVLEY